MNENQEKDFVAGEVLLLNKPVTWSSFDVVGKIRNVIRHTNDGNKVKVGHAGTLDPLADGLMILCTGRKTKEIETYQAQTKEYVAEITFGSTTPSYDLETQANEFFETNHITEEKLTSQLQNMLGEQEQIPPVFSAKKVNGQRVYKKARKGIAVKMKPTQINLFELELKSFSENKAIVRVLCSKGTYIRSLAYDLGKALESGAHLSALTRTKIGDFLLEDAYSISDFQDKYGQKKEEKKEEKSEDSHFW